MNDKIKQLWEEAAKTTQGDSWQEQTKFMEKFAELIVRECARVARATPCPYTDELMIQQLGHTWDMASSAAGREIVQHFRVEK